MTKVKNSPLKHKEGNIDAHKVSGAYFGEDKFHEINPDIVEVEEVKPSEIVESVEGYVKLKRKEAEVTELRTIVREELKSVLWEAWPERTGGVKGLEQPKPNGDYRQTTPQR